MDQQSVDDLLSQVQAEAAAVSKQGGVEVPAAQVAGATAAPTPAGSAVAEADPGLAGEFAPPPTAAGRAAAPGTSPELRRLLAIEVPVIVQLGQRRLNVGEVMRLSAGAIIEFAKSADDELELLINNKPVGRGHAVKVGENFGLKITSIGAMKDMIRSLGGQR